MYKKFVKLIISILTIMLCISFTFTPIDAAVGKQGYAVYRDGVFFGLDWHAGMMVQGTRTNYKPVAHAPGTGSQVKADDWSKFMDGNNFKGVYRPNKSPTSAARDLFVATARSLGPENISYNLAYQMYYDTGTAGSYVSANEISSMRCDGVVEFVYEFHNYRVYGSNTYWDITKNSFWGRDHHSGTAITPKKQVNYLTKVSSSQP
ncbi:hypothetical protein [Ornithinibacillus scapharcae]|uniref:hypothetical protein n=1 Tax=Ornithinibacillus scapharcae TaxID=1147159 RepID=UPI000225B384|nr:hypothetical protein [Ornithinibacillus scapharcae]